MGKTTSIIGAEIGTVWLQIEKEKNGCLIKVGIDGFEELIELVAHVRDAHGVDIDWRDLDDIGYAEAHSDDPKSFSAIRKWISENTNWFRR